MGISSDVLADYCLKPRPHLLVQRIDFVGCNMHITDRILVLDTDYIRR